MAIFVTGDTHAKWVQRLGTDNFPEGKNLTKEDYVIVLGDFGYWTDSPEQRHNLKWLEEKPFTTLWVDGNHENYDGLKGYPIEEWHGGKVQKINDSCIHLMRGQVYEICGKSFFVFGGAASHDIKDGILEPDDPNFKEKYREMSRNPFCLFRVNHVSWWKEEMPSKEEYAEALANLARVDFKVDYILTHDCPTSLLPFFCIHGKNEKNQLNDFFENLLNDVEYKQWFGGHHHFEHYIDWAKFTLKYEDIERIV